MKPKSDALVRWFRQCVPPAHQDDLEYKAILDYLRAIHRRDYRRSHSKLGISDNEVWQWEERWEKELDHGFELPGIPKPRP